MNKTLLAGIILTLPSVMAAQSAVDAYSISQSDLRGSARFMSMGGAFTALGGDISTLNQNPAGIGVFRSSDISATLDINMMNTKTDGLSPLNKTKVNCNNFGYVGAVRLNSSAMPFFNWGASYSRVASFDRHYRGNLGQLASSYTNFVANNTTKDGYYPGDLYAGGEYNPYQDYEAMTPWSSILLYNAYSINPLSAGSNSYTGLFNYDNPTSATGYFDVEERGYIDEYAINFGGNVMNTVYWGIGFGITDVEFKQYTTYGEDYQSGANVPYDETFVNNGAGYTQLDNYKRIFGSGFNFKAGVIVKPVNEFRIGLAVHTPTYYNLTYQGQGAMSYDFTSPTYTPQGSAVKGTAFTDFDEFDFKTHSPWRLMVGVAGVIGSRAIISADYEYRSFSSMKVQDWNGNDYRDTNEDISTYYQSTNILRLGAEFRITPQVSLRAGYSYESSPVKSDILDPAKGQVDYVYTSGPDDTETQPAYTFDRSTQYITAGLGYRYKRFYADLAYVHRYRSSDYHAYTDYIDLENYEVRAPRSKVTDHNNSVVLTLGFKF